MSPFVLQVKGLGHRVIDFIAHIALKSELVWNVMSFCPILSGSFTDTPNEPSIDVANEGINREVTKIKCLSTQVVGQLEYCVTYLLAIASHWSPGLGRRTRKDETVN